MVCGCGCSQDPRQGNGSTDAGRSSLLCSEDGRCPCSCDYVTDPTCGCRDIAGGLNVSLTKTPVYATYPLLYARSFNAKPYEVHLTRQAV